MVREQHAGLPGLATPFGEALPFPPAPSENRTEILLLHGGWGKIAAAASAQYAIDRWQPRALINMGTCGGFGGDIAQGEIVLADFTIVYDILEQMGDGDAALAHYATELDLSWLKPPLPHPVTRTLLVSADRDIVGGEIESLRAKFGAVAADWESGAIAYVARRNSVRCLILRGVSDVVSADGGEAYGDLALFHDRTRAIMSRLLAALPQWVEKALAGLD